MGKKQRQRQDMVMTDDQQKIIEKLKKNLMKNADEVSQISSYLTITRKLLTSEKREKWYEYSASQIVQFLREKSNNNDNSLIQYLQKIERIIKNYPQKIEFSSEKLQEIKDTAIQIRQEQKEKKYKKEKEQSEKKERSEKNKDNEQSDSIELIPDEESEDEQEDYSKMSFYKLQTIRDMYIKLNADKDLPAQYEMDQIVLILCMYTMITPQRNNYANLYIVEEEKTEEIQKLNKRKENYLLVKKEQYKMKLIMNKYKTVKTMRQQEGEEITSPLYQIIQESLQNFPRKFLLREKYDKENEQKISAEKMRQYIRKLTARYTKIQLGSRALRQIYMAHKRQDITEYIQQMENIADKMNHNVGTSIQKYGKKGVSEKLQEHQAYCNIDYPIVFTKDVGEFYLLRDGKKKEIQWK